MRGLVLLLAAAWVLFSPRWSYADTPRDFTVAPVPSWVLPLRADMDLAPPSGGAAGGMLNVLADDQFRVGKAVEHYVHRVRRVVSTAGVENAGELGVGVDPHYERLVVHTIRILRGGTAINALDPSTIRMLQQEDDADERIYNGRLSMLVVLRDVRIGDAIDYEYSILGQNPVFGGRFVHEASLASRLYTNHLHVRVLAPASRSIVLAAHGIALDPGGVGGAGRVGPPDVAVRDLPGQEREYTWDRREVPAVFDEKDAPLWFLPTPGVAMSEFRDWADVASWAVKLYEAPAPLGPELTKKVADIRAQHENAEARALAAVTFVQNEIRYLGIEMGENSHAPHAPAAVFAQRFGDCKDKTLLLVMMLRALGLEAHAALVDSEAGDKASTSTASPFAFDHVIVRARLDGKTYFIDPTLSSQGGPLAARSQLGYGRALVVAPETREFEPIGRAPLTAPTVIAKSVYRAVPPGADASLEVETTYSGADADDMRDRIGRSSLADLATRYLNLHAVAEPQIRAEGELDVKDDVVRNVLVVRERYAIPGYWRGGEARISADTIDGALHRPRVTLRTTPLAIDYPTFIREEIVVHFPHAPEPAPEDQTLTNDALTYTLRARREGKVVTVVYELVAHRDSVAPADVAKHLVLVDAMRDTTQLSLAEVDESARPTTASRSPVDVLIGIGGLFGFIALVVISNRTWGAIQRARSRHKRHGSGETASLAIACADRTEAARLVLARRCTCGKPLGGPLPDDAWSEVLLGERTITVARVTCASCATTRTRYFILGRD